MRTLTRPRDPVMLPPDAIPKRADRDPPPPSRKHLSFDPLIRTGFERAQLLRDKRDGDYSIADAVMSAIAMFSLKDPSLLSSSLRMRNVVETQ